MSHPMEKIKEEKTIRSAFDSSTFDATISIHVEKDPADIGSATISPSGRDVAIASKTGLDIIDLDSPLNPPRQLRHGISWNVADVQWSPFALRDYWVASTANQKALVWNLSMKEDSKRGAIEHTLEAHTRAITDINFSAHHPDVLATCAVDGYVNCWDLRRPRRPVMTFVDWDAGATQVKWSRQDGHVLASSHDRWLRIWDDRKGAYPLRSIKAHESKIYGVDWNRTRSTGVVTCSLDKSIKFWDYSNDEDIPERVIRTTFPVWRARHTPFGWGILAMPQNSPGDLYLYDSRRADPATKISAPAVAIFQGHGDKQVKEFLWRARGGVSDDGIDNRDFQLVSWGNDKELRLQRVPNSIVEEVGFVKGHQLRKNLNVTRKGAVYRTYRNIEKPETEKKYATIKGRRHWSSSHDNTSSALTEGMKKFSPSKKYRGRFGNTSTTMKGRVIEPEPRNKIDWMSGIKFSKNNMGEPGQSKTFPGRRLSVISPAFDADREWDAPESLHDEIIRIHQQYTKVTFDDVNMDQRAIIVSMNGPWGDNREPVFIKVNVKFPDQYPEKEAPVFDLGRTSLISDNIRAKIIREVEQIAAGFVSRKRGSLEAAICYFLGEVDLEESTMWFGGTEEADDLDELADESSSDDDDKDIPIGASATMSQELDSSATDGMLAPQTRRANAPPPVFCGGRFNANGKLVCFFPPKEEKFKSLLGTTNLERARPHGAPYFNTFSSLKREALPAKGRFSALEVDDVESSDSSGGSQASSSSDSDSSQFQASVAFDFWRRVHGSRGKTQSTNRSQKSSIAATGSGYRGRHLKPKNTISIHDIQQSGTEYIPSKRELAHQYAVFGDGLDVCNHNARIAAEYGFQDRADIWTYAGMLLRHEVPLEVLDQSHRKETILVIARDMVQRCRRDSGSDSGVDVSFEGSADPKISGRVKWGHSPLAKPLIDGLFDHFERLADIQMLAMLSCVFSEPSSGDVPPSPELRLSQPQTPLSMKTPAFSLDYFPTGAAAWSVYQKTPYSSIGSTPKTALTPNAFYGSLGSSNGPWSSDPASASYSTGETPPKRSRSSERLLPQSQSLSIAPEETRGYRRSNTGLASSFAANFTRPFTVTLPSSPPRRKRPSPVENMLSSLTPAVTWGNTTVLESVREKSYQSRASYSDDETTFDDYKILPVTSISVRMFNQDSFDDEGCLSSPLLDCNHSALFSGYRKAYSDLLYAWNLTLPRLEILKFDGLPDYFQPVATSPPATTFATSIASVTEKGNGSIHDMPPPSPTIFGKREQSALDTRGLDVTGYCLKHDSRLEPLAFSASSRVGGAVGRCERCKMEKAQLRCVVCTEPTAAMYVSCLSCGCASHQTCLDGYHAVGETRCPGGCECDCNLKAGMGMVESWGALLMSMRVQPGRLSRRRDTEEWEASEMKEWESARRGSMSSTLLNGNEALLGGKGYSTLSKRLGQVRNTELGAVLRRKGSTSKREEGI